MKKNILTIALLASVLSLPTNANANEVKADEQAQSAVETQDRVEDAIREATLKVTSAVKKNEKMSQEAANDSVQKADTSAVTVYSDTTDNELEDDTTDVVISADNGNFHISDVTRDLEPGEIIIAFIVLLCIVVIPLLIVFALPLLIIWLIARSRRNRERERNALLKAMMDNGNDVSPYVNNMLAMEKLDKAKDYDTYNDGIKKICIGVGLMVFIYLLTNTIGLAAIGFIIVCVGVGQILTSKKGKKEPEIEPEPEAETTENYEK